MTDPALSQDYIERGWAVVPVKPISKAAYHHDWPKRTYSAADFIPGGNIGIKLGDPSGGLVDVDCDCPEAIALAPLFLPPTGATFGRTGPGKTSGVVRSWVDASSERHFLYTTPGLKTWKPTLTHVELRSTGAQTVGPGSIHQLGMPIVWVRDGAPARVDPSALEQSFARLAAATLVARTFHARSLDGNRHDACLAFSGALWHAGWSLDDALGVLLPAWSLDGKDEPHREQAIRDTWDNESGRNKYGWPTLEALIGEKEAAALRRVVERCGVTPRGVIETGEGPLVSARPLTDLGNAERFVDDHGADLRYVVGFGWHQWDGTRWAEMSSDPIHLAGLTARKIRRIGEETNNPQAFKWGHASEARGRLEAMISIASKLPGVCVTPDDLDADPWLFSCDNGTIDLRTGTLREHRREDMATKVSPIAYDPEADAPRFRQFLIECMDGDLELAAYVLRFLGYALTGDVSEHALALWYGPSGANGKSTTLTLMGEIFGNYATTIAPELLLQKPGGTHPTGLMDLRGARLVTSNECPQGRRWDESLVKQLTGNDRIKARRMRENFTEFRPSHKLVIATNHRPLVRETGESFWRRVHLTPWAVSFRDRADPMLGAKLSAEAPGVLRLLVWGCLEWQRAGRRLVMPESMKAAVDDYRESQDTFGQFVDEVLQPSSGHVPRAQLFDVYRRWCEKNAEFALSSRAFYRICEERGFEPSKVNGVRGFRGWSVRQTGGLVLVG